MTSGRERALPPLDFPSGESSWSRFSGAMTQNSVFIESKTLPFTHSHFVTRPLIYHETAVVSLGKSAKPKKSFILTKNKPLHIALLFAKV